MEYSFAWHSTQFVFHAVVFLFSVFFTFLTPGLFALKHLPLSSSIRWTLALPVGIALWGLQGWIFGWIGLRDLSFVYILLCFLLATMQARYILADFQGVFRSHWDKVAIAMTIVGVLFQLVPVFPSGFTTTQGMIFHQINAHDALFYITIVEELLTNFPPYQPGLLNVPMTNYHFWANLVIADLSRIWGINIFHLYFQFIPLLLSPLFGLLAYFIVKNWTNSQNAARWAIFLTYFSGDLNYIFMLIFHRQFSLSPITIDNGIIQFINMPQAFAKVLFYSALLAFSLWIRTKNNRLLAINILLSAVLVGFKVYFGIAAAVGLTIFVLSRIISSAFHSVKAGRLDITLHLRNHAVLLLALLVFALVSAGIFFPLNSQAGGLFWVPLAWPKLLLGAGQLDWREWWLRLQVYESANSVRNVLIWNTLATVIFFIAIYGVRLIGLLAYPLYHKKIPWSMQIYVIPIALSATFIGTNFLQVSGGYNSFNFFVVALTILTLLSAVGIAEIQSHFKTFGLIIGIIIVAVSTPRAIGTVESFLQSTIHHTDSTTIPHAEIDAYKHLRLHMPTDSVYLAHPGNPLQSHIPYISLFTGHHAFYGGARVLRDHNQPVAAQNALVSYLMKQQNSEEFVDLLDLAGIDYFVIQKQSSSGQQPLPFTMHNTLLKSVYENTHILVIQPVDREMRKHFQYCTEPTHSGEW